MRNSLLAPAIMLCFVSVAGAAELQFELYAREDGQRKLIASGRAEYSAADFAVSREERNERFYGTRKVLEVHDGLGVGILETYDSAGGFGLSMKKLPIGSNPNEFSWEWYDPDKGSVFSKRQGGTRVQVAFAGLPMTSEVQSVSFLEDAEFEYVADMCCKDSDGGPTHILRILSGSVLEFPR